MIIRGQEKRYRRAAMKKGANHIMANPLILLARPGGFEPPTFGFVEC